MTFRGLADIEALERTPYEEAIPARTHLRIDRARGAALSASAPPSATCRMASPRRRRSASPMRAAGQHPPRGQPVPPLGVGPRMRWRSCAQHPGHALRAVGRAGGGPRLPDQLHAAAGPRRGAARCERRQGGGGARAERRARCLVRRAEGAGPGVAHGAGHRLQLRAGAGAGVRRARLRSAAGAGAHRRAVPHRRHHRRAQAGAAHARQRGAHGLVRAPLLRLRRAHGGGQRLPAVPRRRRLRLRPGAAGHRRPRRCCPRSAACATPRSCATTGSSASARA